MPIVAAASRRRRANPSHIPAGKRQVRYELIVSHATPARWTNAEHSAATAASLYGLLERVASLPANQKKSRSYAGRKTAGPL